MTRKTWRRARTDYPAGVIAVYDNGGKTFDRYTVVYEPYYHDMGEGLRPGLVPVPVFLYVGMSHNPFWPQGFCQHGEMVGRRPTGGGWAGLASCGKVIRFEDLPPDCQRAVKQDLKLFEEEQSDDG